ncbi:hypothetical protein ABKV19_009959 [Rosa sericea]
MGSNKAFFVFALVLLIISSEVAARDLLDHSSTHAKMKEYGGYERKLASGGGEPITKCTQNPNRPCYPPPKPCPPYIRTCRHP